MPHDARAYLSDIIVSCDAIQSAIESLNLDGYRSSRLIRSAVEREFIIIGEAISVLSRLAPEVVARITHAGQVVGFRNQLTHAYPSIDDEGVWVIATRDVPVLRSECAALLEELGRGE